MEKRNARRECLNFKFDDTPEGQFVETVFAAQGQLEREQNRRQVMQKMRARIESGYWVFPPPLGYRFSRVDGHGKMIIRDEPNASIVTEALQGFADGRFQSPMEVLRFMERHPTIPRQASGKVGIQVIVELLRRPLYAGYITVEKWDIHLQKAKHEALIDFATWQRIQDRLKGRKIAPCRADISEDFALRGFVVCAQCDHPMTAAWTKGRSSYYPYYFCQSKGCSERKKSIRREDIEGEFEEIVRAMQPAPKLVRLVRGMLSHLWDVRLKQSTDNQRALERELVTLELKSQKLIDRLMETETPSLVRAYERQIAALEEKKVALREKAANSGAPQMTFDETYRTACAFLANPWKLWASGRFDHRPIAVEIGIFAAALILPNRGLSNRRNRRALQGFAGFL